MSDKTIKICDFCDIEIQEPGPGHGFILTIGDYQEFMAVDGSKKDACVGCCKTIDKAFMWLNIEFDKSPLWKRAGYTKDGDAWKDKDGNEPGYVAVYGWKYE